MASISKRASGEWQNTSYGIRGTATDTITTLPTTIYSDGTNAMVIIKGNTVQNGTPTPDNPIMPQGTGERTGNLMPSALAETKELNGVTITCDGNGTYTVTGTATENTEIRFTIPEFTIPISDGQGGNGTLSFFNSLYNANARITIRFMNGDTLIDSWSLNTPNRTNTTYSALGGKTCNKIILTVAEGMTTNGIFAIMFTDDGKIPSTYEPYGYKIPISSAGQTTPVYLGEVETTRKIKKWVLTGEEDWYIEGSDIFYTDPITEAARHDPICSHYSGAHAFTGNNQVIISQMLRINIKTNSITHTVSDFKAYLAQQYAAGTPVTLWYVLAESTTGIVNEPLMKIEDYADEVNNISIPTTDGANVLSVDTTVQPSEVSVNYHGWHMGTVHERTAGQWD